MCTLQYCSVLLHSTLYFAVLCSVQVHSSRLMKSRTNQSPASKGCCFSRVFWAFRRPANQTHIFAPFAQAVICLHFNDLWPPVVQILNHILYLTFLLDILDGKYRINQENRNSLKSSFGDINTFVHGKSSLILENHATFCKRLREII